MLAAKISAGEALKPGDKVYAVNRGKALMLVNLGTDPLEQGVNILGAHIDSPRLDVKQNPMEEKSDLLTLDTHYYGGIKKYQWVTVPLAIHGVVAKKDGTVVNVAVGEDPQDPVFCISDLLPHLAREQLTKEASKVIEGEMLDVLVGGVLKLERTWTPADLSIFPDADSVSDWVNRSEERRVGKECRSRWSPYH